MITPKELAQAFERNMGIIEEQVKGLSHEQCLIQPPVRGNCMNWVLGHMAETRNSVCKSLGQGAIITEDELKHYKYGSKPICGEEPGVLPLARLLEVLRESQKRISATMPLLKDEDLNKIVKDHRGDVTLANRLVSLYFHDSYHVGQLELLRQLAGTNDHII